MHLIKKKHCVNEQCYKPCNFKFTVYDNFLIFANFTDEQFYFILFFFQFFNSWREARALQPMLLKWLKYITINNLHPFLFFLAILLLFRFLTSMFRFYLFILFFEIKSHQKWGEKSLSIHTRRGKPSAHAARTDTC